jgi:enamine deaminase RidA (YjgF/YER057c/UK114 family)
MGAETRLKELGLVLPPVPKPVANYLAYRLAGNLLFLSGQGPRDESGNVLTGKLGSEIGIDEGYRRARLVGLGLLAAMRDALGSLDRVDFIVKLLGMVNAMPNFNDSPKIINGCSDLFVEVFGAAGRHARSAVGNVMLPTRCRSKSRASSRSSRKAARKDEQHRVQLSAFLRTVMADPTENRSTHSSGWFRQIWAS